MKVQIRHAGPPQRAQLFKLLSLDWTSEDMSDFVAPRGMLMEFLSGVPVGNLTHVIADHESEVCARQTLCDTYIGWASDRILNIPQSPGSSNSSECSICFASLPSPPSRFLSMCCRFSTKLLPTCLTRAALRENASLLRSGPQDLRF